MKFANLNISSGGEKYEYKVGFEEVGKMMVTDDLHYTSAFLPTTNINVIHFFNNATTLNYKYNSWVTQKPELKHKMYLPAKQELMPVEYVKYTQYDAIFYDEWSETIGSMPTTVKMSNVSVFFPNYSLETDMNGVKYAFNVYIWINGFKVILGSYLLNRFNATARTSNLKELEDYFDVINIDIIDPKSLIYDDEWRVFRETICKEKEFSNYVGVSLCFDLEPVEYDEESDQYLSILSSSGGENSIVISNYEKDEMHLSISHNIDSNDTSSNPGISCSLIFHKSYNNDMEGLKEYLMETYNTLVEDVYISYDLSLRNDDNIYFYNIKSEIKELNCKFDQIDELGMSDFERISWAWMEAYEQQESAPLYLQAMCNIYIKSKVEEEFRLFLYFKSNKIPFTQELCSYFTSPRSNMYETLDDFWNVKKINLDNLNMNYYTINAVNKTENIIKHFDYVSTDSKSNIVQPIFYKAQPLSSITLHRDVNENIAINLDQYKSKVKRFKLKIGNTIVPESGRVKTGIIFIIKANQIAGVSSSGVYHVINERNDVVTSGNYTCI